MKTLRLFTMILLAVLVFSTWAPAYAKPADTTSTNTVELARDRDNLAKLRVVNHTGGTLYVSISGPKQYHFSTAKQGRTIFDDVIEPGKYTLTVYTSACGSKLTFRRNVNGGTVSFPSVSCKRK